MASASVDPKADAARQSKTGSDKTRQCEVWCVYLSVRLPSLNKHFLHCSPLGWLLELYVALVVDSMNVTMSCSIHLKQENDFFVLRQ